MTAAEITMRHNPARPATWRTDAALAAAVALLALCVHAASGFPTLNGANSDNDSLLRLVEVRDLIDGQGWFDLHQYRMGAAGGIVMHWSRLVDAPIAAIMLAVSALTGSMAMGETAALIAWPTLLMAATLAFMLRIARAVGGDWALLPALTIGGAALHFGGAFVPGDIDHHNVQLVLTMAALTALVVGRGFGSGVAAGVACALMLAVGMETVPYVAVAGLTASAAYLLGGRAEALKACGFGTGFAVAGAGAFVATVPYSAWLAAQCDAYSIPQFTTALVSGIGLAAATAMPALGRSLASRLAVLAALGALVAAVVIIAFPQCLAAPYSGLDPRFQTLLLSAVSEAQPFWSVVTHDWVTAVNYYVTPTLGLVVLGLRLRQDRTPQNWIVAALLCTAFAVSLWQVRGATFSIPLATLPLAAWVGEQRRRVAAAPGRTTVLVMALSWLAAVNVSWGTLAVAAVAMGVPDTPLSDSSTGTCYRPNDYATLAAQPATTVLSISNLGSPILAYTQHRAFAGLYHRNAAANVAELDTFMGTPDEALTALRANGIGVIAICRGNGETAALTRWAPNGLMAAIVNGNAPAWLEKLPQAAGEFLEVYRVRPAR